MNPQQRIPIDQVCKILELPITSWTLRKGLTFEQAQEAIENFKTLVKKQKKILAKKYHPDRTGEDDNRIKEINNIIDMVMKIELKKAQPPTQVRYHFRPTFYSGGFATSSSSNSNVFSGVRFYTFR